MATYRSPLSVDIFADDEEDVYVDVVGVDDEEDVVVDVVGVDDEEDVVVDVVGVDDEEDVYVDVVGVDDEEDVYVDVVGEDHVEDHVEDSDEEIVVDPEEFAEDDEDAPWVEVSIDEELFNDDNFSEPDFSGPPLRVISPFSSRSSTASGTLSPQKWNSSRYPKPNGRTRMDYLQYVRDVTNGGNPLPKEQEEAWLGIIDAGPTVWKLMTKEQVNELVRPARSRDDQEPIAKRAKIEEPEEEEVEVDVTTVSEAIVHQEPAEEDECETTSKRIMKQEPLDDYE